MLTNPVFVFDKKVAVRVYCSFDAVCVARAPAVHDRERYVKVRVITTVEASQNHRHLTRCSINVTEIGVHVIKKIVNIYYAAFCIVWSGTFMNGDCGASRHGIRLGCRANMNGVERSLEEFVVVLCYPVAHGVASSQAAKLVITFRHLGADPFSSRKRS